MWVPDTSRPGFAEECARQSRLVASVPEEKQTLGVMAQAAATIEGWE